MFPPSGGICYTYIYPLEKESKSTSEHEMDANRQAHIQTYMHVSRGWAGRQTHRQNN